MNNKNIFFSSAVTVLIAVGLSFALIQPKVEVQETDVPISESVPIGAQSQNISSTECHVRNGVEFCYPRTGMNVATTTVCALKSPPKTSILRAATVDVQISSTTATTISIARASTAYATTTILGSAVTLNANEAEAFYASTTDNVMFAPNSFLVVGMSKTSGSGQTGTLGVYSPTGTCGAEFQVVN